MLLWLFRSIKGYVRICLKDGSPERFLNLCSARGFKIWNIVCRDKGEYEAYMTVADVRRVKPLVRKSGVRLRITGRFGFPFFIFRNRKRWYYAAGLETFFILLYCMTLFIWDIEFEGNYRYTEDNLRICLEKMDLHCGILKKKINCEEVETFIRTDLPEVTWVSASVTGTRLVVKIRENQVLSAVPQIDETPCDLVAGTSGVIRSMVVRSGIAQVSVGDTVEKGQILVSGRVPVTGDNGDEITSHLVRADADIEAETVIEYEKEIPFSRMLRIPTGQTRKGIYVKAGPWSAAALFPALGKKEEWDYYMEEHQAVLFSDYCLPLYLGVIEGKRMISYEKAYTKQELALLAERKEKEEAEKLEEKGVQILENNDRIEKSVSGYRIKGEMVALGPISQCRPVEEISKESEE